jgi:hypothetical protein
MRVFNFWSFWVSRPLSEDIVEIIVKCNKNIRRVEIMTSHPLQNAFSLNWVRLIAAVKLAIKNRKTVRRWNNFALNFGKNIKHTLYFWGRLYKNVVWKLWLALITVVKFLTMIS